MRRFLFLLWCLLAVVFDANATADSTANGVTSINHSNLTIGGALSNGALVAQIVWANNTPTAIALKWDNLGTPQSLAQIPSAAAVNGNARAQLWGLVAPTSGNKQLNAAWTGACDVYVNGTSWQGVNQTGGATSFPNGTSATGTGTTGQGVTVTSATNNAVMACHATASAVSINSVNNTQTFRDNAAANGDGAANRAAGAATVSMTATYSGSAAWASAGTDIAAAASATFLASRPVTIQQAVNRADTY